MHRGGEPTGESLPITVNSSVTILLHSFSLDPPSVRKRPNLADLMSSSAAEVWIVV